MNILSFFLQSVNIKMAEYTAHAAAAVVLESGTVGTTVMLKLKRYEYTGSQLRNGLAPVFDTVGWATGAASGLPKNRPI